MMRRDTMLALCKAVRRKDVEVDRHDVRNVIESHIEALDRIDGGQTVAEREKQLRLVIADLRECLRPDGWDKSLNSHWANKARYTVDMIEEMLKGKGLQWNREWAHDGANEADPETYTGLSGAMSFTHVQKPATWPKAALQVGPEFQCPDAP